MMSMNKLLVEKFYPLHWSRQQVLMVVTRKFTSGKLEMQT